jgi:hypothetical protein
VLARVQETLRAHAGAVPVMFCFIYPDNQMVFLEAGAPFNVTPSDDLVRAIEAIAGEDTVWLKVDADKLSAATSARRDRPWEQRRNGNGGV